MSKLIAMVPARIGSQRLKKKNLREVGGVALIRRAIRKCKEAEAFDEVWVNAAHPIFGEIAQEEGVEFHKRPEEFAGNDATSEGFVYHFMQNHQCDFLFQVHSIAPLLSAPRVREFAEFMVQDGCDTLLSAVNEQIECAFENEPINFRFDRKTNSQELKPIQRVTWSITGWRPEPYIAAYESGAAGAYAGRVAFFPINRLEGHIIKTEEDLQIAEALVSIS